MLLFYFFLKIFLTSPHSLLSKFYRKSKIKVLEIYKTFQVPNNLPIFSFFLSKMFRTHSSLFIFYYHLFP